MKAPSSNPSQFSTSLVTAPWVGDDVRTYVAGGEGFKDKPAGWDAAKVIGTAGLLTSVFGGLTSAVGSSYAAQAEQYKERSQASSLQFQANMDAISAHQAEISAQSIQEAGQQQVMRYTMQAGQEKAASQVATAARGVDLSSGSAVTERASQDVVKDLDVLSLNSNAVRAAWAQRTQATNYSNEALLARTSANNLNASADTISPGLAATTSLLGSATKIASQWDWARTLQKKYGGGS